jgi:hypothetical protein
VCRLWRAVAQHALSRSPAASLAAEPDLATDEVLFALATTSANGLRALGLPACTGVTGAGIAALRRRCGAGLARLSLARTAFGAMFFAEVARLPALAALDLTGCVCATLAACARRRLPRRSTTDAPETRTSRAGRGPHAPPDAPALTTLEIWHAPSESVHELWHCHTLTLVECVAAIR